MKQITLNFREVAVDGLPKENMTDVYVVFDGGMYDTSFSKLHGSFGCLYSRTPEEVARGKLIWKNPIAWIPVDEILGAMGAETP